MVVFEREDGWVTKGKTTQTALMREGEFKRIVVMVADHATTLQLPPWD